MADVLQGVHELAVEVVKVDLVVVDYDDFPNTEAEEVHDDDGTEATGAKA